MIFNATSVRGYATGKSNSSSVMSKSESLFLSASLFVFEEDVGKMRVNAEGRN